MLPNKTWSVEAKTLELFLNWLQLWKATVECVMDHKNMKAALIYSITTLCNETFVLSFMNCVLQPQCSCLFFFLTNNEINHPWDLSTILNALIAAETSSSQNLFHMLLNSVFAAPRDIRQMNVQFLDRFRSLQIPWLSSALECPCWAFRDALLVRKSTACELLRK